MNTNTQYPEPKIDTLKILNYFIMLLNCLLAVSFASFISVMRKMIVGDAPLGAYEGPAIVEFLLRKEFIIIPLLLVIFMVIKEFKVKPAKNKLYINLFVSVGIFAHAVIVFAVPFAFGMVK
ncbi:MAG: hypothetical protein P8X96_14195 [Desulfobacteraceae bacterium]|jgi:hypothetical protein